MTNDQSNPNSQIPKQKYDLEKNTERRSTPLRAEFLTD